MEVDLIVGADTIKSVMRTAVLGRDVPFLRTEHSAYRLMVPTVDLEKEEDFTRFINPRQSCTTMVVGESQRLIMGPARNGSVYSVVAMVPDENMHKSPDDTSWTTAGRKEDMLESFKKFPDWAKRPLFLAKETGLWQLRDIDPLPTWLRCRVILIGDACHAMLPTQGQGASQSIEDAEALGEFFADMVEGESSGELVESRSQKIFSCRYDRVSLIQAYSRQVAKSGTEPGSTKVQMNPAEFMNYNCSHKGARNWIQEHPTLEVLVPPA